LPLLPDAPLSVADVHALVASEPNAIASSTKIAEKRREIVMMSLLMGNGLTLASSAARHSGQRLAAAYAVSLEQQHRHA
jgi:hypothetical protein